MTNPSWHDLLLRLARLLPPVARLHDQRNELQKRLTMLEQALATGGQKKDLGFLVEIDYPLTPKVRSWDLMSGGNVYRRRIEAGADRYRGHLLSFLDYASAFTAIPARESADQRQPYWGNLWLPSLDAICLSGLVTRLNPRRYVEVGSGNSTKFVRRAISDHGLRTSITSIDPHPRAEIDKLCDRVIRSGLEDCDLALFADLGAEDVVFIDNSHRSFQNSDVTVFFTEVLPLLKSGCHYGIHDIFLPDDYPADWLPRFYNEQYLLMAYLLGGANGDEIVLPVHYVQQAPALLSVLDPLLHHPALGGIEALGGAFWMKRR